MMCAICKRGWTHLIAMDCDLSCGYDCLICQECEEKLDPEFIDSYLHGSADSTSGPSLELEEPIEYLMNPVEDAVKRAKASMPPNIPVRFS